MDILLRLNNYFKDPTNEIVEEYTYFAQKFVHLKNQ